MAVSKNTPSPVNVDELFQDFPPTVILAPGVPFECVFNALRKTQVEIDGRMQDAYVAEVTTIRGDEIDRVTGEISPIPPGEPRSWWIFGTVVREELKEGRPVAGERMVILDRGLKLKRTAVKEGKSLSELSPSELKDNAYHDTHVAFPDRPQKTQEEASFDDL